MWMVHPCNHPRLQPYHSAHYHLFNLFKGLMTFWPKIKPSTHLINIVMTFWVKLQPSNCRFMKNAGRSIKRFWNIFTRREKWPKTGKCRSNSNSDYHCQSVSLPLTDGPWHLLFESKFMWMVHRVTIPALRGGQHCFRGIMTFSWKIKPSFWRSTKDFSRLIKRENAKSCNNISSSFLCTYYLCLKNYVQTCIIYH